MRRTLITLCSLFLAVLTLTSCEDQLNIMFKDFYVCIKDSNNTDKSTVLSTSNEFWVSYFVYLVSEKRDGDLTVQYEVIPGDGLKEGVDYKLTAVSAPRSRSFQGQHPHHPPHGLQRPFDHPRLSRSEQEVQPARGHENQRRLINHKYQYHET